MQSIPNDVPPQVSRERCSRLTQGARSSHVIAAAIRLFAHKGFEGTKTKEIAEAAGINEALIFRDFRSKEKLYCAILEYASTRVNAEKWIQELSSYAEQRDDQALFSNLAMKLFESFGQEQDLFRLMLYSALEQHELARKFRERQIQPLERFLSEYMRGRQAEGAYRNGDAEGLTRSFLSMCHHHLLQQVLFADATPNDVAAKTLTEVFLDGVRSH